MERRGKSELWPWLFAAAISLGLHGGFFYQADTPWGLDERDEPARAATTRVSFRSVVSPQPQPVPAAPAPEPRPEPPREVETPPPPRPEPRPEPVERPRQPEPQVVQQVSEPESAPQSEPQPAQPTATASAAAEESKAVSMADEAKRAQAKRHYLAQLLAHIERHKFYPRAARRRGLEGEISVSLTLLEGGGIRDLSVTGGHRLLRQATEDAIEASLPMPQPPEGLDLPLELEFSIQYRLH